MFKERKSKDTLVPILPHTAPVIQEIMISTEETIVELENLKRKSIEETTKRDRLLEKSCFSEFHQHFHPDCKKTFPLKELIQIARGERTRALDWYEKTECKWIRRRLLKAIPGMSTVLGGEPWSYSDSYSAKQTMEIYIYFLSVFLIRYPWDVKSKRYSCSLKGCESKRLMKEIQHQ